MTATRHLCAGLLLACASCATFAQPDLRRLAWMGGCWTAEGAESGSGEHWLPLAGGTLLGVSRTVRNGRTAFHEFMQIREQPDGNLAFRAEPSGKSPETFPLLRLADDEVVFENPRSEFPQRVTYRREGRNRMVGRIEGLRNGRPASVDFPLQRVSCDALLEAPGR